MIDARARGLANIHAALMTVFVAVVFWAWALINLRFHVPYIHMNPDENFTPYFLCVVGGMLLSVRAVSRSLAARFHLPDLGRSTRLATRQVGSMAMLTFAMMFATQDHYISRLFLGSLLILCWVGLSLLNAWLPGIVARFVFQKGHRLPTVFIGKPGSMEKVREWIANKEPLGIYPVGLISPVAPVDMAGPQVPWLGTLAELPGVLVERLVGQVVMLELPANDEEAGIVMDSCRDHGCRLLIHSNLEERYSQPLVPVTEEGRHFYTLQEEPLEDPLNRIAKRTFDIAVSLPVVVIALPLLCTWVKAMQAFEAPGPLFHTRERRGKQGQNFRMLKFRSMYSTSVDAAAESVQTASADDRIFPFGHFMRKRSLDEFPQFWNVLVGEMSIVGPRPYMPILDEEFRQQTRGYRTRNLVKPGITGLSQSLGFRGAVLEEEMVQRRVYWDVYYISHWSMGMDIQITFRTLLQVVTPPATAF
ncbi:MAG TPA: sugar transferase [Opitutaceae bacterium]|jgi:lipopolysaccharide/colanic/teichoic acid biosynthesis glycosyltransferase|nr:sugar transferase [Opitutaceae bacterium]